MCRQVFAEVSRVCLFNNVYCEFFGLNNSSVLVINSINYCQNNFLSIIYFNKKILKVTSFKFFVSNKGMYKCVLAIGTYVYICI